ncbi:MAG TPA: hypothetical protein VLV90_07295 [Burkholderiales bacterium]|nr:hypothetical protein [Burkholderiales bacterium]
MFELMSQKLVLYFTANGHALYRWHGGALELESRFAPDEAGLEEFRGRLRGRAGALVYVLADLAGEDFHEDQIPYLRGGDRQAVVDRRLAQRYRDTRLAAALSLGYATGERRSERLLLASFTNTQQFTAWLDALAEAGARLSGVYSVPLVAPALAARLGLRGGRAFVVTANSTGLRQCYLEEGRLRFARLERTADMAPDALAAFVRAETMRLAQYLSTLRVLPREGPPVQVLVIAPRAQRAAFEQVLVSDARLTFRTVVIDEAARKIGMKQLPAGAAGEQLFLHLAVRRPPKGQFARGEDRRSFFLWQLQRGILAAGAAGLAACVLFAAWQWLDLWSTKRQIATLQRDARAATQQYERITASFPVTQTSTDNLKATVVEFTKIASRSASPEPALVYLSHVVDKFPQMEIESVQWRIGKAGAREEAAGASGATAPAPAAAGAAPASPNAPPAADAASDTLQVLEVTGRVNATRRSDYRAITGQVQQFAEALRTDPSWRILRTQLPFDVTPDSTLSGDIGAGESTEAPKFSVTLGRAIR